MEKIVKQALLFDFYGELLTEHQKQIYEDVILNDYSLSEVAEERGISRQGVHDLIRRSNRLLEEYEEKLKLVEKFLTAKKLVEEIHELAKEAKKAYSPDIIEKMERLSSKILEEL